ncbi:MAG: response regulator [Zoogloeaceae bacterium]|jgi:CheY-like chemotaxis protein|nr:response regulator [Zoogloeaceae bacterium]
MTELPENKPIKILLVEDNPGDVRLIVESLRESRVIASMVVAKDGVEALEILQSPPSYEGEPRPDLILLDLNLPRMDGREFLEVIKNSPEFKHIPVVILTISSAKDDIVRAYKHHVDCFITKPVDPGQFINILEAIDNFQFSIEQGEDING